MAAEPMLMTKENLEWMKELAAIFKNDPAATTTPSATVLHGLNPSGTLGLFGAPGVDPRMYATIVRANGTFTSALPFLSTPYLTERVDIVTGINAATGTNPANFCGDPKVPGSMKVCRHDYEIGKLLAGTEPVNGIEVGMYYNRADVNRDIIPPQGENSPWVPEVVTLSDPNSQAYKEFLQLGTVLSRAGETVLIQGLSTAPATGAGSQDFWFKQFDGLDRLIRSGYRDVPTQQLCAAVDSDVRTFNANINTTDANGDSIVDVMTDMYTGRQLDASNMGYELTRSAWAFLIHPRMWRPLTRQWPCNYVTMGCNVVNNNGERVNVNAEVQRAMQDEMFTGKFVWIDGERVPVLFSWGINAPAIANEVYNSSIYLVNFRLNGYATTYFEYADVGNTYQEEFFGLVGNSDTRVVNGGMYRLGRQDQPFCIRYLIAGMGRLRLDAPFVSGRIDSVWFSDRTRQRAPIPGASFYVNGGVTTRNASY